jgi:hypothetical protein
MAQPGSDLHRLEAALAELGAAVIGPGGTAALRRRGKHVLADVIDAHPGSIAQDPQTKETRPDGPDDYR